MRFESESTHVGRLRRRRFRFLLFLLTAGGGAFALAGALRVGPPPAIELRPEPRVVGREATVAIRVSEPTRGLGRVTVEVVQNGVALAKTETVATPRPGWKPWGPLVAEWNSELAYGKSAVPALAEGDAALRVTAERASGWLRGAEPVVVEKPLVVRLTPPRLEVTSTQHYVAQGGVEAVVYRVGETSVRDGVEVGERFFPGHPLPGGAAGERFALFALPYDTADASAVRVVAVDDAGNARQAPFVDRVFPQPPGSDTIELDDRFLSKVVPEILAETPELVDQGNLLANYLEINGNLRRRNAAELVKLAQQSRPEFLWRGAFLALPGGQVMSSFADRRTYVYGGRQVDRQDHLGFDLASTSKAEVPAANRGVVVLARWFGIYGNTVVVDHGYGLASLYAHLSSIEVATGQVVERGQRLGRSGATGLAAGDHLHFSFLLHGLPVRPIEWWDAHWIEDRLKRKLGSALPFESSAK